VSRGSTTPVYGADISSSVGPFDVYAEAACLSTSPSAIFQLNSPMTTGAELTTLYSSSFPQGPFVQASGGINYSFGWRENRLATVGAEYFYNQLGYTSSGVYPLLIFLGQYQPFYTGRHYAAVYVTAEGPDAEQRTSYTLSTIGNAS